MNRRRLKVGLLGLGRLGQIYARQLATAIPQVKLVAVSDPVAGRAREAAEKFSVPRWYARPEELLDDREVQAVVISSPTLTHCEQVEAAAGRGKAIFCEKPPALTLEEAYAMKRAVETNGVFFQMGFMRRFDRGYRAARQKLDRGAIGVPVLFKASSRDPYLPSLEYVDPKSSGGLFVDMGIHDFDLARWLIGEVKSVHAIGGILAYPQVESLGDIDNAAVTLRFASGALGIVDLSRSGIYGYDITTEVLGTKGTLRIGYLRDNPILVLTENSVTHDTVPHFPQRFGEAYVAQLENFAANVLSERLPPVTIDDGIEALRISLDATQAYRTGQTVEVASGGPGSPD